MYPFSQFFWKRQTGDSDINITLTNSNHSEGYWLLLDIAGTPGLKVSILLAKYRYTGQFMKTTSNILHNI